MDQPFTKGEKAQAESAADQWIRRYIYTCEYAFPHLQKRIQVTKQRDMVWPKDLTLAHSKIGTYSNWKCYECYFG